MAFLYKHKLAHFTMIDFSSHFHTLSLLTSLKRLRWCMAASAGRRNLYILLDMMKSIKSAEPLETRLWPATKHSFSQSSYVLLMRKAARNARKRHIASSICYNFPYSSQACHTKQPLMNEITGTVGDMWMCVCEPRSVMPIQTTHASSDSPAKGHASVSCIFDN